MTQPIVSRAAAIANGDKTYYTGEKCRRGHLAPRYTSCGICTQCVKDSNKGVRYGRTNGVETVLKRFSLQVHEDDAKTIIDLANAMNAARRMGPAHREKPIELRPNTVNLEGMQQWRYGVDPHPLWGYGQPGQPDWNRPVDHR